MPESIREALVELGKLDDLPTDPNERAEALATRAHRQDPQGRKLESFRREAAKIVPGADPPLTGAQQTEILEEDADRRSARGRARRAQGAAQTAGRRTRGARRRAQRAGRSVLEAPRRALRGATSVRGVIAQMFGLVILYWLLRTASRAEGASFLEGLVAAARRPFEWLFDTEGVPSAKFGPGDPEFDNAPPSVTQSDRPRNQVVNGVDIEPYVGRWRYLIEEYFPPDQWAKAERVMYCESRGNPDAVNQSSGASGLFQHLPRYWDSRSQAAGFAGASPFNAEANVATAAWLYTRGGWGHWPNCGKL